jgi:hypothetical protein
MTQHNRTTITLQRATGPAWCLKGAAILCTSLLLLSPGQAHLPDSLSGDSPLLQQSAQIRTPLRTPLQEQLRRVSMNWRCQAVCDETGRLRQTCLMLADPRLSGLGQGLDHLSKAQPAQKSLGDLGLLESRDRPTC